MSATSVRISGGRTSIVSPRPTSHASAIPSFDQRVRAAEEALALRRTDSRGRGSRRSCAARVGTPGARTAVGGDPLGTAGSSATIQPPASSTRRSVASRTKRSSWVAARTALPCPTSSSSAATSASWPRRSWPKVGSSSARSKRPAGEPGHEREPALLAAGEPVRASVAEGLQREREPLAQLVGVRHLLAVQAQLDLLAHRVAEESELRVLHDVAGEPRDLRGREPPRIREPRRISPASGRSSPSARRRSVVLPLPFGPDERDPVARRRRHSSMSRRTGSPPSNPNRTSRSSRIGNEPRSIAGRAAAPAASPPAASPPAAAPGPTRSIVANRAARSPPPRAALPDRARTSVGRPDVDRAPVVAEREDEVRERPRERGSMLHQHDRRGPLLAQRSEDPRDDRRAVADPGSPSARRAPAGRAPARARPRSRRAAARRRTGGSSAGPRTRRAPRPPSASGTRCRIARSGHAGSPARTRRRRRRAP